MLRIAVIACALLSAPVAMACDTPLDCAGERAERRRALELSEQAAIDRRYEERMQENYEAERRYEANRQHSDAITTNTILMMQRY